MLTLLRHGVEKDPEKLHGWEDAPLLPEGVAQAERAKEYLSGVPYKNCYSSDLTRTMLTAETVVGPHPMLVVNKAQQLRSINLGLLQGQNSDEVKEKFNALWDSWRNGDEKLRAPEGESWYEFQGRVYPFMFRMQQEAANADVLAVTHSHVADYACAIAANGGRPLYGNALDLVRRFKVETGNAAEFRDGRLARLNYIR